MQKHLFNIAFFPLIFSGLSLYPQVKSDLVRENIKGKVKSIVESAYFPFTNYDKPSKKNFASKIIFKYDEKGNTTEAGMYERKGNLARKFIYRYDEVGHRTSGSLFVEDSILKFKYGYRYDDKGNRIAQYHYSEQDSLRSKIILKYNVASLPAEFKFYNPNDSLIKGQIHKYNDSGDVIEIMEYKSDGSLAGKFHFTYDEFDKMGNWITQVSNNINTGQIEIVVRKIEYY